MRKIQLLIDTRYSFSHLSNSEIRKIYAIKKSLLKNIKKIDKKKINYLKKNIHTFEFLEYLYHKRKLSTKDHQKLLVLYKKFNSNLKLKKIYNKRFKKNSNKNCNIISYLYLSLLIKKINSVDRIHKLNTVLKINDILIYSKIPIYKKKNLLGHSILYEKKLISYYL